MLARVQQYRRGGPDALVPSADTPSSRTPAAALQAIVARSPFVASLPALADWLRSGANHGEVESFFYWSKEHYGGGKPVIGITQVAIVRPSAGRHLPALVVAGKQIFATHYVEGSLGLTMVVRDGRAQASYLVYLNRSQLDVLRGVFGGIVRGVLERRLRAEAPQVIQGLRARLESGAPPADPFDGPEGVRRW
jgi:hypothetical protein